MKITTFRRLALALAAVFAFAVWSVAGAAADTRQVPVGGTGSLQTGGFTPSGGGDATQAEFPGQLDSGEGPGAYPGSIVNRSLSTGSGHGASANSGAKAKSNPTFNFGFEGLNHYQQRYSRGGNQFSLEPPDQGLCVGNGYEVEAVNDVINVYNAAGVSVLPDNTSTNIVSGLPEEREPRRGPELVLRLRAGDQPVDVRPRAVRHRPELSLRRRDAALLRRRPDAQHESERVVHAREPPRHRGQPDGESDG